MVSEKQNSEIKQQLRHSQAKSKLSDLKQVLEKIISDEAILIVPCAKRRTSSQNFGRDTRASKYRGVSRNGKQWQVQLGSTSGKRYIGCSGSEEDAAAIYDKNAILANGLIAKTNFPYTKMQIL